MNRITAVEIKIERAKQHLHELETAVQQFFNSQPYLLERLQEPETGDLVYRVRVRAQPPAPWDAIIGDVIHNLRASLDFLVCQLVEANGTTPSTSTMFPIAKSAIEFEAQVKKRLKGVSTEAERLIRAVKPYQGGNDLLWQLHQLDIIDKHRLLIPVGSAYRNLILDGSDMLRSLNLDWLRDLPPMPFALRPADRQYPLQDGAVVYRVPQSARLSVDENPQVTIELAFGKGEPVEDEPLIDTLRKFVQAVQATFEPFRPLL